MTEHAHRGPSYKNYLGIFVGLAVLTGLTVVISYSGLGHGAREFLAFVIAGIKAFMVALIFMHLRFERRPVIIFAITPIVLAIIFILAVRPDVGAVR